MAILPHGLRAGPSPAGRLRSMHDDRLMPVLHERGVQLRLADGYKLNLSLRSIDRRRLKQRRHPPIGQPRRTFDQFIIRENDIFAGRLNAIQVTKGEWTIERDHGPCCPDSQSEISQTELSCWPSILASSRAGRPCESLFA